jgi:hypothetical protein
VTSVGTFEEPGRVAFSDCILSIFGEAVWELGDDATGATGDAVRTLWSAGNTGDSSGGGGGGGDRDEARLKACTCPGVSFIGEADEGPEAGLPRDFIKANTSPNETFCVLFSTLGLLLEDEFSKMGLFADGSL